MTDISIDLPKIIKITCAVILLMVYPFVLGEIGLPSFTVQAFDDIPELGEIAFHKNTSDNLADYFASGMDDWKLEKDSASLPVDRDRSPFPEPLSESHPLAARHHSEEPVTVVTVEPPSAPPPPEKLSHRLSSPPVEETAPIEQDNSIGYLEATALAKKAVWHTDAGLFGPVSPEALDRNGFDIGSKIYFGVDELSPDEDDRDEE